MTIVFITVSVNGKKSKPSAAVGASFQIGVDRKAVYTAESKAKIDDARTAYDALTDAQKALVENDETRTAAESRCAELKAGAETPDTPDDPTDPTEPSGDNLCKWDNVDHVSFLWGRPVKFFHSVLSFFAHLFGRRSFSKYENMFLKTGWLF